MFEYFWNRENRLRAIMYLLVISLSLVDIMHQKGLSQKTSWFKRTMIDLVGPLQSAIFYTKRKITHFTHSYFALVGVKQENRQLKQQIIDLKHHIFQLKELRRENQRLKDLLKFGEELQYKKILARVIGWDASSHIRLIRVNRGTKNGVQRESPVIASEGLVGHVYQVSDHFSDIMTIINQSNRVDGIVVRTRSHGIIEGHSNGKCIMKYVTRSEPVELNDQIVTSGLGSIYPKGLRVGKISKIERESYGITQFVEVEPDIDFGKLEEVIILQPNNIPLKALDQGG